MKVVGILLFVVMLGSAFTRSNNDANPRNTSREKVLIDSESKSTNCDADGWWILYKNQRIAMKGHFENKKLICGIQCSYNPDSLIRAIYKYEEGKLIDSIIVIP